MPDEIRAVPRSTIVPGAAGEAAAPHTQARTPESAAEAGGAWLLWRRAMLWGKRALSFSATLSTTLLAAWIIWLMAEATLLRHSVELEAITAPRILADDGWSTAVVTQRLRDAMKAVQDGATTTMAKSDVGVRKNLSEISIPKAGVSVESVAASIRGLLPESWRQEVSGEVTQSGTQLSLRLRLNGRIVFSDAATGPDAIDTLIKNGAFRLVAETQPFVAAYWLFEKGDFAAATEAADRIIASRLPEDENVARAYNLKGLIARAQGDDLKAEAFFSNLPNLSVARFNLGVLRYQQHKLDDAIAEYRAAIRLDPKDAAPHNNLGMVWYDQKKPDDAIAEYRAAIRLDPKFALPHISLGMVWYGQKKLDDAIAEYRAAIRLDPKAAMPHITLGMVWYDQKKLDDAIAEYRAAIRLDSKDALSYYNLGLALREAVQLRDACAAFMQGANLAPTDPDYPAGIREIDDLLQGKEHCPPAPADSSP